MPEIELSIKKARSILKEAKKDYGEEYSVVYEGDIPDDEKKMVEEAVEVVEMAEQAKANELDHPAIDKILFLAEVDGDSSSNPEATEEPWEGYDKEKLGKIIQKLPKLDESELAQVFDYERENKNRDTIIETLEEMGAEAGGGESDEDYKPWGKYDEEKPARIIAQIEGMKADEPEYFEKILKYEEENKDRKSIKAVLEETIEEKKAKAEDSGDDSTDSQEDGEEEGLTRQDIEDMDLDGLRETLEYNGLDPDEIIGDAPDLNAARVKVAAAFELEWPEGDEPEADASEPEEDLSEEGVGDLDWETLEQLEAPELKDLIKEKDLGMRITAKSDLTDVRERIADKLGIEKPAPVPWRGYDKREVEQIVKKLPKLDDVELSAVFAYESENKNRKTIMKKLEEIAEERGLTTSDDSSEEPEGSSDEDTGSEEISDESSEEEDEDPEAEADEPDHDELIKHITQRVEEEHFAVPAPLPENVTTLPFDLTELSDKEVRQQYSAFLSYFGRAVYVAKIEKQLGIACKNIADDAQADALASLDKLDPETEKEKSATQLKAEAERDPKVRKWRKRERRHNAQKESMRADAEIYKQNLDSLSREWTMRTEEIDHSGGLGPRGKTGKKAAKKARK